MATRLMTICHALISNPHLGISEKESYFEVHFLNARNEVNEIERTLGIELKRARELSPAGRHYTRYTVANAEQIRKIANFYNGKLKANPRAQLIKTYPRLARAKFNTLLHSLESRHKKSGDFLRRIFPRFHRISRN